MSADQHGCFYRRIDKPFRELIRFGVEMDYTPLLPSAPDTVGPSFQALLNQVARYDVIILQRVIEEDYIRFVKEACFLLNKPMVHEVDDDYLHLEPHNPCYFSTAMGSEFLDKARMLEIQSREYDQMKKPEEAERCRQELQSMGPQLEEVRLIGLEKYKRALSLFDAVWVTTEELRQVLLPYNKNIYVLPNQVDRVYWERDYTLEEKDEKTGGMKLPEKYGMVTVPAFCHILDENMQPTVENGAFKLQRVPRIGYAGTLSHRADFETISDGWDKLVDKYAPSCHFVYIGDPYFYHRQRSYTGKFDPDKNPEGDNRTARRLYIPETDPNLYHLNLRNLDIGIAPLEPTIFNMSKSDLKALEYAAWGICPVLPSFITYSRAWVHQETCMFYSNAEQLYQVIDFLLQNPGVREKIGRQAQIYVANNRLEKQHAEHRYNVLKEICGLKRPLIFFPPKGVTNEAKSA